MLPPRRLSICFLASLCLFGTAFAAAQSQPPVPFRTPAVSGAHAGSTPPLGQLTTCQPQWLSTFGGAPIVEGEILAQQVFDDGTGPALYVGGTFASICGVPARDVARWDGSRFSSVGSGVQPAPYADRVRALAVWDDGGGRALYAAGSFTGIGGIAASNIAKWNGTSWSPLGAGVGGEVCALCVFDDGSGPALFAGGSFLGAGGQPANCIAKWDGSNWAPLGAGIVGYSGGIVLALAVYDDGSGPALFVGGQFDIAGGMSIHDIARWDGATWSALSNAPSGFVASLTVFDDGAGPRLFLGGQVGFGVPTYYVLSWDGSSFSTLAGGTNAPVYDVQVFDDGTGAALYAGGTFTTAGAGLAKGIARWSGNAWSALASGPSGLVPDSIQSLCVYDAGSGPALFAAGAFTQSGSSAANYLARWDSSGWSRLGDGVDRTLDALLVHDDGTGPALYAGGDFGSALGAPLPHIARWNGSAWTALGSGLDGRVYCLASFDDGSGPALYAGGAFTHAGGVSTQHIARWRAGSWTPVGLGMDSRVSALAVHDDGSGPALYASGYFEHAGGVPANRIARWNGSSWSPLGNGMNGSVLALAVYDAGSGPLLYAGGEYTNAGGSGPSHLAKWNGSSWSVVSGDVNYAVLALVVHDDGSGRALFAGGRFTIAGGLAANRMAKWNGSSWAPLGSGISSTPALAEVRALAVHDEGSGRQLFVGGSFDTAGGTAAGSIARWDGSQWSTLGSGMSGAVNALASLDDGSGPALFAGGTFLTCVHSGDSFFSRWEQPAGCSSPGASICEPGSAGVSACPCANPPSGAGRGCDNSSSTGGAQLTASGAARVSNDTLVLATSGEKASATSVVLQGDAFNASGVVFGQGVRCVAGSLKRLYVRTASGGAITAPGAGDPSISARSAALGSPITQGTHRYYGVYYRDPTVLGGCPSTSTFNLTQQLDVLWYP